MASLLPSLAAYSSYKDRYYAGTQEMYALDMKSSKTIYIGNLSFYTTEEQLYQLFSTVGEIKRIIMGLDRHKKTPCGFCFVEFHERSAALDAMLYVNSLKLDDRPVKTDLDPGFKDGRQFGRGRSGGQMRDEFRKTFDAGRGGYGAQMRGSAYDDFTAPEGQGYQQQSQHQPTWKKRNHSSVGGGGADYQRKRRMEE